MPAPSPMLPVAPPALAATAATSLALSTLAAFSTLAALALPRHRGFCVLARACVPLSPLLEAHAREVGVTKRVRHDERPSTSVAWVGKRAWKQGRRSRG